jgi:hypothetical protein
MAIFLFVMEIWLRCGTKYATLYACRLSRSAPGRKRGEVTADDVVAAAIDIVDREGVDAVTIRRVTEACGPSPMPAALRPTRSRRSDERRSPWAT